MTSPCADGLVGAPLGAEARAEGKTAAKHHINITEIGKQGEFIMRLNVLVDKGFA